jgi:outer membrane protein insertion porin family
MKKRCGLLLFLMVCLLPMSAFAVETPRVLILPFEVFSQENLADLGAEIPQVMQAQLGEEGALVTVIDAASSRALGTSLETEEQKRSLGRERGADYVIWGTLTQIGRTFSLETRLVSPYGDDRPASYIKDGTRLAALSGIISGMVDEMGLVIFRWQRVAEVVVTGNKRIEADAIRRNMKTGRGDIFRTKAISEDIRSIYKMGYFKDVRVEADDGPDGKILTVTVAEKATIRGITIVGNSEFDTDEIKKGLDIATGAVLNLARVSNNAARIEALYKESNYHNVKVTHTITERENNQVDVEFVIDEGKELKIKEISFEGNAAFDDDDLRDLMKTTEESWLSFITQDGDLVRQDLNQDIAIIASHYHNNGYIDAKVDEPQMDFREDGIYIKIKIAEGDQYRVGTVNLEGDLLYSVAELMEKVKTTEGDLYSRATLRNDILRLSDTYQDAGYAYVDVAPAIEKQEEQLLVNLTLSIRKGPLVYFERISITGNTKTRDKVIRRELDVYERELYSGTKMKKGIRKLNDLDYFEDVRVNTTEGSTREQMNMAIDVTEKATGAFSFGGGYSTANSVFGTVSVSERNLFGRGQIASVTADVGGVSSQYRFSFTEPWLFDIPLNAGFDVYKWEYDYEDNDYDRDSIGGVVRFSYPVYRNTRLFFSHSYDISDINGSDSEAPKSIQQLNGTVTTHAVATTLRWDSRDNKFIPRSGSKHEVNVTYAGLGGDIGYVRTIGETWWFYPLFWGTAGSARLKGGWMTETGGEYLPDYELFHLGGINSLRGFERNDLGPLEPNLNGYPAVVGGDRMVQFNLEYLFPIYKDLGIAGLVFYDTGNIYGEDEDLDLGDLASSVGTGVRWASPMGPIRIEYGYVVDPSSKERASGGKFEFAMGASF